MISGGYVHVVTMSRPSVYVFSVVQGDAEFTHPYTVISRAWGATEFIEGSYSGVSSPNPRAKVCL